MTYTLADVRVTPALMNIVFGNTLAESLSQEEIFQDKEVSINLDGNIAKEKFDNNEFMNYITFDISINKRLVVSHLDERSMNLMNSHIESILENKTDDFYIVYNYDTNRFDSYDEFMRFINKENKAFFMRKLLLTVAYDLPGNLSFDKFTNIPEMLYLLMTKTFRSQAIYQDFVCNIINIKYNNLTVYSTRDSWWADGMKKLYMKYTGQDGFTSTATIGKKYTGPVRLSPLSKKRAS